MSNLDPCPVGLLRALVVDGEADARRVVCGLLYDFAFECVQAADGIEALKFASDHGIDLIVTDVHMPRMDGLELVDLVQRGAFGPAPPPVIVCSACFTDVADADMSRLEACAVLMTKPLDVERFATAISHVFPSV